MKSNLLSLFVISFVLMIPFKVVSQATCPVPTNLATNSISTNSAIVSWTAPGGTTAFIVQYRPLTATASAWVNVTTQGSAVSLANLLCNTAYEWHVSAVCNNGTTTPSPYSASVTFTTLPCASNCIAPSGPVTTNITTTGATLSWTAPAGALAYMVQYRPLTPTGSPWISVNAQTNHITLTNLTCGTVYQWQVATICSTTAGGTSAFTTPLTFTTQSCTTCVAPTGLSSTSTATNTITLSWVAPTGSFMYIVQYRPVTTPAAAWINVNAQGSSITLTNLTCNTHYEWHVAAYCGNSTTAISPYSATANFTTAACAPTCVSPGALVATNITTTGATLSWSPVAGAVSYSVQYHQMTPTGSPWITVTTQSNSITLTNLTCGSIYQWQVATICGTSAGGVSPYATPIIFTTAACPTTCTPPSGLTTTNITTTGAVLSWTAQPGALNYIVQYHPLTPAGSAWINVTTQSTSVGLTNLTCGTAYEWHVATFCANGATIPGPYSSAIVFTTAPCTTNCITPSAPVATTNGMNGATLTWNAVTGASGYLVQYHAVTSPASAWINVTTQTNSVTLTNLVCGTHYEWHVATVCGSATGSISPYTTPLAFTTAACPSTCNPPAGLVNTNITTTGAVLSWVAPVGALAYIVQYHAVTTPASPWINITTQTNSVTLTNLVCGTHYEWHVATLCSNNTTVPGPYSSTVSFTTASCTPPTCLSPLSPSTTNIGTNNATFIWAAMPGALAYQVQYSVITSATPVWINVTTQSPSVTLTNLICGTHYQWHVQTLCGTTATNISPYSAMVTFTTLPCTNPVCPVPTGLTSVALSSSSTSRMLTWSATGALVYNIRYRLANAANWTTTTSTTNSKLITGLQLSGHYEWQVQSLCSTNSGATGISAWSQSAFFDTPQSRFAYPNPATGVTIQLPVATENEARVSVVVSDRTGRTVKMIDKTIAAGGEILSIDIANLEAGMYFIQLKSNGKNEVQKLFITR